MFQCIPSRLYALFLVILCIAAISDSAAAFEWELTGTTALDSNTVLRGYGSENETLAFHLELPAPGIATVDLVVTGAHRIPAKIELREAAGALLLEQSATHLAFAVREGGTFFLRAGAEDPDLPLGRYKLVTSFVEARVFEEVFSLASRVHVTRTSFHAADVATKGDPEAVEPDPGSLTLPGGGRLLASFTTLRFLSLAEKGDPEAVEPDPGSVMFTDPSHDIVDQVLFYEATCRRNEIDDHGDTTACATPLALADSMAGEIGSAYGDDVDVFVLALTELTTVEIVTTGDADTFGVLCDRSGQRLAMDDDGAGAHNFRIVTTLAPGRYFVRVEGGGAAKGAYELTVAGWQG